MTQIKKLIEVALPLEDINEAAAREKSIRHGHPSTLHLWWARRPLAAARAVIWASLVDAPSSHPEKFPTEEAQNKEQERLFDILRRLVKWENTNDEKVLAEAREEIHKSMGDDLPEFLDPFAGGGAIPLEAQRLGLKVHAHDLNPVAVMINKAMIEIPPKFAGMPPVNPDAQTAKLKAKTYKGAAGLAEDVAYYGQWMKAEAFKRIGHLYPKAHIKSSLAIHGEGGTSACKADKGGEAEATVIAWIWARTVKCPNPACGCQMPLVSSFVLSKKANHKACIRPIIDKVHKTIQYTIEENYKEEPESPKLSRGAKFKCLVCGEVASDEYIKSSISRKCDYSLMCSIVELKPSGRLYLYPNSQQISAVCVSRPLNYPNNELPYDPRNIWCTLYGLNTYDKLFTNRQLVALTTFSDLVGEAYTKVKEDATNAGRKDAEEYAKAIVTYLAFVVDKIADRNSSICSWDSTRDGIRNTFGRQAIPMVWDFAESNPFCNSSGCFDNMLEWVYKCIKEFPTETMVGIANNHDAQTDCGLRKLMVSTDPPYYDNIGYADLSDFFYIWMRRSLKPFYPELFATMLVPKKEELVATPYRFDGNKARAKQFFEDGMLETCKRIYQYSRDDIPVSIYYAYKQSDAKEDGKTASSGWETMLTAIIQSGFMITGTWPMETEMANRNIGNGTNALASSIVIVCRKRAQDAPICSMKDFQKALSKELADALKKIQSSNLAPVDLAQAAIGPGMAVFSRYSEVLKADGSHVSIREALELINKEIDKVLDAQNSKLDAISRVCLAIFEQYQYGEMKFGEADTLARAKNTSVDALSNCGAATAAKGIVKLNTLDELPELKTTEQSGVIWNLTHYLVRSVQNEGFVGAANLINSLSSTRNVEHAKELAYRLYSLCDRMKLTQLAVQYNMLVTSWTDIMKRIDEKKKDGTQGSLGF